MEKVQANKEGLGVGGREYFEPRGNMKGVFKFLWRVSLSWP